MFEKEEIESLLRSLIGEDLKISNAELTLSYGKAHTYWFSKKVVLKS